MGSWVVGLGLKLAGEPEGGEESAWCGGESP